MYLIKRGGQQGGLDRLLERQAIRNQVNIVYNSKLSIKEADIVAIGINKPTFIASGVKFACEHPDRSIVILDDDLSFKIYNFSIPQQLLQF